MIRDFWDVEAEIRRRGWSVKAKPTVDRDGFVALITGDRVPTEEDVPFHRHFIGWGKSPVHAIREALEHAKESGCLT